MDRVRILGIIDGGAGRVPLILVRIAISAGLLVWLIRWKVEFDQVGRLLTGVSVPLLLAAVGVKLLDRLLVSLRWYLILRTRMGEVRYRDLLRADFVGSFFGIFLPSAAGGDVVRVYSLANRISSFTKALTSLAVDRVLSIFALLSTLLICLAVAISQGHSTILFQLVLLGFLGFLVFMILFVRGTLNRWLRRLPPWRPLRWALEKLDRFQDSFVAFQADRKVGLCVLGLAFLNQVTRILTLFLAYRALRPPETVELVFFFIFVPMVFLVALLPVSLGGLGVREAAFVFFFEPVGMLKEEAFSMSLLAYAAIVLVALPGGLLYARAGLVGDRGERAEPESDP